MLRQANAHQVTGTIEFHGAAPATFYLDGGHIYAAAPGVDVAEDTLVHPATADEVAARRQVVALLAAVLDTDGGWYFHDPLGQHPGRGAWRWETATLLMETRAKTHADQTLAPWSDRRVELEGSSTSSITLGTDAWSVVVALARETSAVELRDRLGWNPGRLLAALAEIEQTGALGPDPAWGALHTADAEQATPAPAAPPEPVPEPSLSGRHRGPLAPPPVLPGAGGGSQRRRKLTGRRPGGS
ncbi:hypothetical protein [Aquihabitans sp. McL0605]|uniref:hypothetical protein n=1 Tax=Aquihabitans sp. McL0605 TaxID=3415671 RepID=UPI003CF66D36